MRSPPRVDRIVAPLAYRYPVTEIIKNIKYNQKVTSIPVLAYTLAESLSNRKDRLPALMLPVPLAWRRWLVRGFNQSIEICKTLHWQLKIPFEPHLIRRQKNTPPLFQLNPEERARQLRGAFSLAGEISCDYVAIVDDVVTTGSTVNELALLLRDHGVAHIEVWALARTC